MTSSVGPGASIFRQIYNDLGLSQFFGTYAIKELLSNFTNDIKPYVYLTEDKILIDKYNKLIDKSYDNIQYVRILTKVINELKLYQDTSKNDRPKFFTSAFIDTVQKDLKFFEILVNDKKETKQISETPEQKKNRIYKMISSLQEFIKGYKEVEDTLREQVLKPFLYNVENQDKSTIKISPIFLSGSPGVGKSRFVDDIVSKLDIISRNYNKSKDNEYVYYPGNKLDIDKLHPLTRLIYESKMANKDYALLFIDEIDKKILNDNKIIEELLIITGGDNPKIYDPYLGIDIDIKNIIIIAASNMTLNNLSSQNEQFEPLKSRFVEIKIPDISKQMQYKIIIDKIENKINNYNENHDHKIKFNNKNREFIKEIIDKNNYSGAREAINFINSYYNSIVSSQLFEGTQWGTPELDKIHNIFREQYIKE